MRDLETGAQGTCWAPSSRGICSSVGYDMYLKIVRRCGLEERGDQKEIPPECAADPQYHRQHRQKLRHLRRAADGFVPPHGRRPGTREDADELLDEIVDRYGDPPKGRSQLIDIARCGPRPPKPGLPKSARSREVSYLPCTIWILQPSPPSARTQFSKLRVRFSVGDKPLLNFKLQKGDDPLKSPGICGNICHIRSAGENLPTKLR